LDHLIGTNVLRAYMHGFFVDLRLYEKARAISNPFEYEEHKKQLIQKKIEEKRQSRITAIKKLPKVNRQLAQELMNDKKKNTGDLLKDDRFNTMFSDSAFEVDTTSHEYKIHHPSEVIYINLVSN
jgi:ribosome biogenesis protein ENP2